MPLSIFPLLGLLAQLSLATAHASEAVPSIYIITEILGNGSPPVTQGPRDNPQDPLNQEPIRRQAREIRDSIARREQERSEYLPRVQQSLVDQAARNSSEAHSVNQKLLQQYQQLGAQVRALRSGQTPSWDEFAVYSIPDASLEGVVESYLKAARGGDFRQARRLSEQLVYSNHNVGALPGVNSSGVMVLERIRPQTPSSPLADAEFRTAKSSPSGQMVRRLANEFQEHWYEMTNQPDWLEQANHSSNLLYTTGLSHLRIGDSRLAQGNPLGETHLRLARELLHASQGLTEGFIQSAQDFAQLLPHLADGLYKLKSALINDPGMVFEAAWDLLVATPEIAGAIARQYWEMGKTLAGGSSYERGEVLGRLAFDAVVGTVTAGSLGVVAKGAKASSSTKALLEAATANRPKILYEHLARVTFEPMLGDAQRLGSAVRLLPPEKQARVLGAHHALMKSARPEIRSHGDAIAREIAKYSGDSFDFLERVAVSQADPQNYARYLKTPQDVKKIAETAQQVQKIVSSATPTNFSGYVYRVQRQTFTDQTGVVRNVTPEMLTSFHPNSIRSNSRMGIGGDKGIPVLSFGASDNPFAAKTTAWEEVRSYVPDIDQLPVVETSKRVELSNVLRIDESTLAKHGLPKDYFSGSRTSFDNLIAPHYLGHASVQRFDGVLLPSAESRGGVVLHSFKELR